MVLVHESQPDGSLVLQWYVSAAIYGKETAEAWIDSLAGWARFLAEGKRHHGLSFARLAARGGKTCWPAGSKAPPYGTRLPACQHGSSTGPAFSPKGRP